MTIEKTITLYQFDEITDEKIKEKILDNYRYIEVEDIDLIENDEKYILDIQDKGFNVTEKNVYYDISYSQGSGACFDCDDFDIEKLLADYEDRHKKIMIDIIKNYCSMSIEKNHFATHYSHSNTRDFVLCLNYGNYEKIEKKLSEIEDYIENLRYETAEKLYSDLQKEYEYLTSDECITECLIANEYYFDIDTCKIETV